MVDVSGKPATIRSATASARVTLSRAAYDALASDALAKGDALGVARIAGIAAAKRTPDLIPLCHSVPLAHVALDARLDAASASVTLTATATTGPAGTGVEMEALVGASVAALALHDMTKAMSPGTVIGPVRLEKKVGGKSGEWVRRGEGVDEWGRGGAR
jgi:cyclic pyranopterin phosphate synthase